MSLKDALKASMGECAHMRYRHRLLAQYRTMRAA